jgi:PAS domain S-box-containing protein
MGVGLKQNELTKNATKSSSDRPFYLLVAVDILTMAISVFLVFSIFQVYQKSHQRSMMWHEILSALDKLELQNLAVNRPGNNVFEEKNVEEQRRQHKDVQLHLEISQEEFALLLTKYHHHLPNSIKEVYQQYLVELSQAIKNTEQIFLNYENGKVDIAASFMAKMDQDFARSVYELKKISRQILDAQSTNFVSDYQFLEKSMQYQFLFVALALICLAVILILGKLVKRKMLILETKALEKSAELEAYEEALQSHAIISKTDALGTITYVNSKFEAISGYGSSELIGQNHRILSSGEHSKEFFKGLWNAIKKGHSWRKKICNRTKNGELYWVDSTIAPIYNSSGEIKEFLSIRYDITLEKEQEKNHILQKLYYENILSSMKDGYFVVDVEHRIKSYNPALIYLLNVDKFQKVEFIDDVFSILSNALEINKKMAAIFETEFADWRETFSIQLEDGTARYLELDAIYIKESKEIIFSVHNISDKIEKQLAVEKNHSEMILMTQTMHFILQGANLGSWDWDLVTNNVSYDDRWCAMQGLRVDEVKQDFSTWEELVHPEDRENALIEVRRHLDGKTEFYENYHRLRHIDGHWVWIFARAKISQRDALGNPTRLTGTHLDVTHIKMLEQNLLEAQSVAKIGSWSFDCKTKKVDWSLEMFKLFGELPSNGAPSFEEQVLLIHEEDRSLWANTFKHGQQNGKSFAIKFRLKTKDNSIIWLEARGRGDLLKSEIGRLWGTCQDITEQVLLEEERNLEKSKTLHISKLSSLGEMSAGIAHEINNPLTIISGTTLLLKKFASDPIKFQEKLDTINRAVQRITKIVTGLRKFSRSSEKQDLRPNVLSAIIQESLDLVEAKMKRHDVKLIGQIESQSSISCDEVEIEQIMVNLLNNAVDAIKDRPVEERWIKIELSDYQDLIKLRILDSGPGIPPLVADKLFQPFFTTKKVGEGTGLGLSIVKGIVDSHHGTIEVDAKCKNTCFELTFPIVRNAYAA